MRTISRFGLGTLALVLAASTARPAEGINEDGFITRWLVLAPIPLNEGQSGADGVGKEQIPGEAKLQPKAGETVKAAGKELTWKEYTAKEHMIDFNDFVGRPTDNSVAYAVVYVIADKDMKGIKMKSGSDDQCRVYLNGKQVLNQTEPRALEKDQETTEITLQKGTNVLVFKVVNEAIDWSGCIRLVDADDKPLTGLKVSLTPN